jgi:hypothetical protein
MLEIGSAAFAAEMQNEPLDDVATVYDLDESIVARRTNGLERRAVPTNTVAVMGFVDINQDGLRWAIAASSNERCITVLDYGIYPGQGVSVFDPDQPQDSESVAVSRALSGLASLIESWRGKQEGGATWQVDHMLVDCGGRWMQSVFDFCERRRGRVKWECSRGSAASKYRAGQNRIGRPGEQWHRARWIGKGKVIVHDADFWRLRQQRGWLLPDSAPDSITLFGSQGQSHSVWAAEVTAERLIAYAETESGILYKWGMRPGARNDWGDVATGLYVAATILGCQSNNHNEVNKMKGKVARGKEAEATDGNNDKGANDYHPRTTTAVRGGRSGKRGKAYIGRGGWRY